MSFGSADAVLREGNTIGHGDASRHCASSSALRCPSHTIPLQVFDLVQLFKVDFGGLPSRLQRDSSMSAALPRHSLCTRRPMDGALACFFESTQRSLKMRIQSGGYTCNDLVMLSCGCSVNGCSFLCSHACQWCRLNREVKTHSFVSTFRARWLIWGDVAADPTVTNRKVPEPMGRRAAGETTRRGTSEGCRDCTLTAATSLTLARCTPVEATTALAVATRVPGQTVLDESNLKSNTNVA